MSEYELGNQLKRAILRLNPHLNESDLRFNVANKHLLNKVIAECSNGMFGRHPRATDELIARCRNAEEFIESLMAIKFKIPTGGELLKAMRDIKNEQPEEHIYAEKMTNGC